VYQWAQVAKPVSQVAQMRLVQEAARLVAPLSSEQAPVRWAVEHSFQRA
jgi:hypothetical protein